MDPPRALPALPAPVGPRADDPRAAPARRPAGPLDPPPGPIVPSYRTLDQVEPAVPIGAATTPGDPDSLYHITVPGSYYLTANINVPPGKHGIQIESAKGVTIDLRGFTITGVPTSLDGVNALSSADDITIRNGHVRSCGDEGIDIGASVSQHAGTVEDITSSNNLGNGIQVASNATVRNCSSHHNGSIGIRVYNNCHVENCSTDYNGQSGVIANEGCTITATASDHNNQNGIEASTSSIITRCSRCRYWTLPNANYPLPDV